MLSSSVVVSVASLSATLVDVNLRSLVKSIADRSVGSVTSQRLQTVPQLAHLSAEYPTVLTTPMKGLITDAL
jgi:hypothetical protein